MACQRADTVSTLKELGNESAGDVACGAGDEDEGRMGIRRSEMIIDVLFIKLAKGMEGSGHPYGIGNDGYAISIILSSLRDFIFLL